MEHRRPLLSRNERLRDLRGYLLFTEGILPPCLSFSYQSRDSSVDVLMESKGGKKKSSSSGGGGGSSLQYEAPLGYSIEDVRPAGGIKKFQSAAYSNCARKPS